MAFAATDRRWLAFLVACCSCCWLLGALPECGKSVTSGVYAYVCPHRILTHAHTIPTAAATDTNRVLRNLTLTIDPAWVRRGQSAQLHCHYELSGAPLYSVKWYRGNLEFYRFSPFENPPAKIFPFTGIKVDVSVLGVRERGKRGGMMICKSFFAYRCWLLFGVRPSGGN